MTDAIDYNSIIDEIENDKNVLCPSPGRDYEKKIPYIGWYWRKTDFITPRIKIGRGPFVGVMENNKWGYDERELSLEEAHKFKSLLDVVIEAYTDKDYEATTTNLEAIWEYFQTLEIEEAQDD